MRRAPTPTARPRPLGPTAALCVGLLLFAVAAPPGAAQAESLELLDATLWMQHAAERQALTRQAFSLAEERLEQALADPDWTALPSQLDRPGYQALPPAVIVDVDETVLDNHWYEARLVADGRSYDRASWDAWCEEAAATPVPGALGFCRTAAARGVTVFYVTNRREGSAQATALNLQRHGFPWESGVDVLRPRTDSSDKTARRDAIAEEHRVLLLLGDNGGDFDATLGSVSTRERLAAAESHATRWGREWIVLPNPMYGDWLGALYDHEWPDEPTERRDALIGRLMPAPTADALTRWAPVAPVVADVGRVDTLPVAQPRVAAPVVPATGAPAVGGPDPAAGAPAGADPRPGPARHPSLHAGPMAAWTATHAAAVWLRTVGPADVQLRHWPAGDPSRARLTPPLRTTVEGDLIATFVLDDLAPGARREYEVFIDGTRVATPWPLAVTTLPDWIFRGPSADVPHAPPELTLLLGSCSYVNEPPFDRPGPPYGGGYGIFESMADEGADLMLWLGDNVYYRANEWESEGAMRRRMAHDRALPELQRLLGTTHHLAIWDDHDYGPNDSDRSFPLRSEALAIFTDYWPDRVWGLPDHPGVFRTFEVGDVQLFLLDDRFWRSPNAAPAGPDKVMFGSRQMEWLADALRSSPARFKLVVNGNQLTNPVVNFEGLAAFPHEQQRLLALIDEVGVEGVLLVSGDRHHTELLRSERPGGPLYELTCSPLTSGHPTRDLDPGNTARVPGSLVLQRNYARLDVTGPPDARRLRVTIRDAEGETLWTRELP